MPPQLISACAANAHQVVVAMGSELRYLNVTGAAIHAVAVTVLEHEVACVDVTPGAGATTSTICAVGLWTDISVRVLHLDTLTQLVKVRLSLYVGSASVCVGV